VICLAPRAPADSVRPRRLADVGARPLNFTVRRRCGSLDPHLLLSACRSIRRDLRR